MRLETREDLRMIAQLANVHVRVEIGVGRGGTVLHVYVRGRKKQRKLFMEYVKKNTAMYLKLDFIEDTWAYRVKKFLNTHRKYINRFGRI